MAWATTARVARVLLPVVGAGVPEHTATAVHEQVPRVDRAARPQPRTVELGRSRLLYAEWLRRENRRTDAREPLRSAYESFSQMGSPSVRRARPPRAPRHGRDRAADHRGHARRPDAQEIQVARMAREGHSNPEIGAQ
jgi:hypothetical protein